MPRSRSSRAPQWAQADGDTAFAHSIVLDVAADGTHVEISLRDVELNPELPPGIFRIRAPAEATAPEGNRG